jgi:hypothetical protein
VSHKGDEYRKRAEEAETLAGESLDLRAAETYHDVATHYRELAEHEDRQARWARR